MLRLMSRVFKQSSKPQ